MDSPIVLQLEQLELELCVDELCELQLLEKLEQEVLMLLAELCSMSGSVKLVDTEYGVGSVWLTE